MFANMDPIAGASDALWHLNDTHDELRFRIVTHRYMSFQTEELKRAAGALHAKITTDTVTWLQQPRPDGRPLIPFHDLAILGTSKADKASVGCDIYIDDSPGNIQALRAAGNDAIIFTQEYNKDLPGIRADTWDLASALIERKLEEQKAFRAV
jgi:beta-phosphoglucomutase-like phosphatase (HAD superfamily)